MECVSYRFYVPVKPIEPANSCQRIAKVLQKSKGHHVGTALTVGSVNVLFRQCHASIDGRFQIRKNS